MADINFTEREVAVVAAVFTIIDIPSLSVQQWSDVATKAGITNGQTARNARFAFNNVMTKLGVKAGGGTRAGGKKNSGGEKRKRGDEDGEVKAEADEEEEAETEGGAVRGKGRRKKVKTAED